MAVYIKGMEMPDGCFACPLCDGEVDDWSCAISHGSYIEYREIEVDIALDTRPDWCPLVPVPPHGRLIDADALADKHRTMAYENGGTRYSFHTLAKAWVEDAPTIIEAEEDE